MPVDYSTNPAVFNKQLTILKEHIVKDAYGAPQSVWHPFAQVMAAIEPLSGREYWQASQSQAEATVRIIIRYRSGITDRMRLRYESLDGPVTYEMRSPPINYLEGNRYLQLMCREFSTVSSGDENGDSGGKAGV